MQVTCKCNQSKEGQGKTWVSEGNTSDRNSPGLDHAPGDLEQQPYSS